MKLRYWSMMGFVVSMGVAAWYVLVGQKSEHQLHQTGKNSKHDEVLPGYSVISINPERVQLLGLSTEKIKERTLTKTIRTVGLVSIDETRIFEIQTKVSGWIEELHVDFVGKEVKVSEPLFSVYSPELFATQEEYILALKTDSSLIPEHTVLGV